MGTKTRIHETCLRWRLGCASTEELRKLSAEDMSCKKEETGRKNGDGITQLFGGRCVGEFAFRWRQVYSSSCEEFQLRSEGRQCVLGEASTGSSGRWFVESGVLGLDSYRAQITETPKLKFRTNLAVACQSGGLTRQNATDLCRIRNSFLAPAAHKCVSTNAAAESNWDSIFSLPKAHLHNR